MIGCFCLEGLFALTIVLPSASQDGETHFAAQQGNLKSLAALLKADPKQAGAPGRDGQTPLYRAAEFGQDKAVELLLKHRADPNASDRHGNTALHIALLSSKDNSVIVKLLLGHGANPDAKGR